MIVIGIDPGASGGIAWSVDRHVGPVVYTTKMPDTETDLAAYLGYNIKAATTRSDPVPFVYIEKVNAGPKMSSGAAFKFGQGYGFLRALLVAYQYPFEEVLPRKWMAEFGMKKSKTETPVQWKNRLKGKAQQLFPRLKITLATADAVLIAEYGRRLRCQPEKK